MFLLVLTKMQKSEMTDAMYENVSGLAIRLTRSALSEGDPQASGNEKTTLDAVQLKTRIEHWIRVISEKEWCEGEDWWDSVPDEILELPKSFKVRASSTTNNNSTFSASNGSTRSTTRAADVDTNNDKNEEDDDDLNTSLRAVLRHSIRHQRTRARTDPTLDPALHTDEQELDLSTDDEKDNESGDNIVLPGLGTMLQDATDWNSRERRISGKRWKDTMLRRVKALEGVGAGKRAVQVR